MKKVTGFILFIGSIAGFLLDIYVIIDEMNRSDFWIMVLWIGFLILFTCGIYYTLLTKFWTSKVSIIESLDRENEIIKKKIEKQELLTKLEALEKK